MRIPGLLESPTFDSWNAEKIARNWLQTGYNTVTRGSHIKRLQRSGVSPSILAQAVQMADHAVGARESAAKQQQAAAMAAQEQQFKAKLTGGVV